MGSSLYMRNQRLERTGDVRQSQEGTQDLSLKHGHRHCTGNPLGGGHFLSPVTPAPRRAVPATLACLLVVVTLSSQLFTGCCRRWVLIRLSPCSCWVSRGPSLDPLLRLGPGPHLLFLPQRQPE